MSTEKIYPEHQPLSHQHGPRCRPRGQLYRRQYTWRSELVQLPSHPPRLSVCLTSSAHLLFQPFQSASSGIFLTTFLINSNRLSRNDTLIRLCFISFVAIPRIESTSTIIFTIISIISCGGDTLV